MTFWATFAVALRDLAMHKFRSGLAALGIIFGVASVEAMVSISEGARTEALQHITVLGVDNIMIRSIKPSDTQNKSAGQQQRSVLQYGLLRSDLEHLRLTLNPRYAVGSRNMRSVLYTPTGRDLEVAVIATEPDYLPMTRSAMLRGRFLSDLDMTRHAQVTVLGQQAARKIFGYEDPIDQTLKVAGNYYHVIGILDNAADVKDAGGDDINNQIFVPLSTARALSGDMSVQTSTGSTEATSIQLDEIGIQLEDTALVPAVAARLENYFSQTHKQKDYQFLVPNELLQQKAATQRIFTVVMASIAGVSLLIGGIGIMNIMLANVYDRRKEIGTRRALGARRIDILTQFVLEASILTTLGAWWELALDMPWHGQFPPTHIGRPLFHQALWRWDWQFPPSRESYSGSGQPSRRRGPIPLRPCVPAKPAHSRRESLDTPLFAGQNAPLSPGGGTGRRSGLKIL